MGMLGCIAVTGFLFFLFAERALLWYARKRYTLVIHVNGTRGKSTVTRMIHALLRRQGMEVFGKTTGSAARLLLPRGTERPVRRLGPANVREQRNMMILGAFSGKRASPESAKTALVFECNAIQGELQNISMRLLKPDITVITNVREDHVREQGKAEEAAETFAQAIPRNSALVTSEKNFMGIWEAAAKQKKLSFWYVDPAEAGEILFPENIACVLGVADCLGIERTRALKAIADYAPDTGTFGVYAWNAGSHSVFFADARAANDIESTSRLLETAFRAIKPGTNVSRVLLLISREDRPDRTWDFMQYLIRQNKESHFNRYLCLGYAPLSFKRMLKHEGVNCSILRRMEDLEDALEEIPEQMVYIFGVGNYCGPGMQITRWLETKRRQPDFRQITGSPLLKAEQQ